MANHYCMFKGKLKFGVPYLEGYNGNPHYAIVVEAPDGSEFVVLANVKSDSSMPGAGAAAPDPLALPLGNGFSLTRHLEDVQRHYLRRALADSAPI